MKKETQEVVNKMKMKRQLLALFILFILTFIFLAGRVVSISIAQKQEFQTNVLSQQVTYQTSSDVIPAMRGSIIDRNGTVLAESIKVYNVIYDPGVLNQFDDEMKMATNTSICAALAGVTNEQLNTLLVENKTSHYEVIGRELEYEKIAVLEEKIKSNEVKGVFIEGYYVRLYPYNTMAADVIGFYNNKGGGKYGVEEYYEETLKGLPGRMFGSLDNGTVVNQEEVAPENGDHVVLTIDFSIQRVVEDAISHYFEEHEARSANVIVMNPKNGEILAMASGPSFDLNDPYNLEGILDEEMLAGLTEEQKSQERYELWKNFAVSETYEPGSTYKPLVLASSLEESTISLDHIFECDGGKQSANFYIRCWKAGGHGTENTILALANSCNVAFMEIGDALGIDHYYNYQHMYGFGSKTNIDVLGEETGLLYNLDQFGTVELETGAFGQGFNVTPIQLITAFSSLINGGYLYEPTVMDKVVDSQGRIVTDKTPKVIRQVISEDSSAQITTILETAVVEGTGHGAQIEGYRIGGKTGTAEKGDRDEDRYVISFIGFAPVEDPQLVVLVVIDEPVSEKAESSWAVNVFNEIMQKVLPYKTIFPTVNSSDTPE